MAAPKRSDMCPRCYLENGVDEPIVYHLGSTQPMKCKNGHVFDDREELSRLTKQMLDQKRALAPKADPPPPQIEEPEAKIDGDITNPLPTSGVKGVNISPIDVVRLTSLLGSFRDSSTLFGSVYALTQELNDTKEMLKRAQSARAVANTGSNQPPPKVAGGDVIVQLVIPERHVGPLNDIAEANGMDLTRYMNAKVEDGLDSMWYYAIPLFAIVGAAICQYLHCAALILM
jgi:hypothetical protein